MAAEWWNPNGKFRPLHKFNPVRLAYIRDQVAARFGRDPHAARPFEGLRILDIGCGGGLLCEPMARLGAEVVGVDPSATNIEVAKLHASEMRRCDRLPRSDRRGAGRRRREIRRGPQHGSGRARRRCRPVRGALRRDGEARRHHVRRHHQPHAEGAGPCHRRRRICAALAAAAAPTSIDKLVRPDELEKALAEAGMTITDRTGVSLQPARRPLAAVRRTWTSTTWCWRKTRRHRRAGSGRVTFLQYRCPAAWHEMPHERR